MRLELTYDPDADAVFVRLADGAPKDSEEVSPGVTLDFDVSGRVVAMEVLPASKVLAPGAWSKAPAPGAGRTRHAAE
jgi:uncharacterized protein YuzE